jgi:membrane-bound metal-dependent hydrolase YbcI (DUF457 family)
MLWSLFILLGIEQAQIHPGDTRVAPLEFISYPWSHSLVMTLVWAAVFGGIYFLVTKYSRGAFWVGLAVLSHWFLDFVSHRADMALYPGGPRFGLGLYNSLPGTLLVEGVLFAGGIWIYTRKTRPSGKSGVISLWSFVAFVLVLYASSIFAPPAPSMTAVAAGNLLFLPSLFWVSWIERSRC